RGGLAPGHESGGASLRTRALREGPATMGAAGPMRKAEQDARPERLTTAQAVRLPDKHCRQASCVVYRRRAGGSTRTAADATKRQAASLDEGSDPGANSERRIR